MQLACLRTSIIVNTGATDGPHQRHAFCEVRKSNIPRTAGALPCLYCADRPGPPSIQRGRPGAVPACLCVVHTVPFAGIAPRAIKRISTVRLRNNNKCGNDKSMTYSGSMCAPLVAGRVGVKSGGGPTSDDTSTRNRPPAEIPVSKRGPAGIRQGLMFHS